MRIIALALLGCATMLTIGCSGSRSLSREAVMADHIASMRPDGTPVERVVERPAPPATPRVASVVTYAPTRAYVPAPPPPPALPRTYVSRSAPVQPVSRAAPTPTVARSAARPARTVRTAPRRTATPRASMRKMKKKPSGWSLFGGGCAGGT